MKPVNGYILIKEEASEQKTKGGLIISNTEEYTSLGKGIVLEISNDARDLISIYGVPKSYVYTVYYHKHSTIKVSNDTYLINMRDIVGIE